MATTASETRIDGDGNGNQHEPSRSGSGDFISNLPDDVLGTIVSLLPTREGARTQALSRRWQPVWPAAPLNLGDRDGRRLSKKDVSKILSDHLGPTRRFSLTGICPLSTRYDHISHREIYDDAGDSRIDRWLGSRELSHLRELELAYSYERCTTTLPPSVFRLAPALRVARFGSCRLPPNLAVDFPHLQQLTLYRVTLTDETFRAVLSGFPALESLHLEMNVGVGCLRVSSPTLRSIGFLTPWQKQCSGGGRSMTPSMSMICFQLAGGMTCEGEASGAATRAADGGELGAAPHAADGGAFDAATRAADGGELGAAPRAAPGGPIDEVDGGVKAAARVASCAKWEAARWRATFTAAAAPMDAASRRGWLVLRWDLRRVILVDEGDTILDWINWSSDRSIREGISFTMRSIRVQVGQRVADPHAGLQVEADKNLLEEGAEMIQDVAVTAYASTGSSAHDGEETDPATDDVGEETDG